MTIITECVCCLEYLLTPVLVAIHGTGELVANGYAYAFDQMMQCCYSAARAGRQQMGSANVTGGINPFFNFCNEFFKGRFVP